MVLFSAFMEVCLRVETRSHAFFFSCARPVWFFSHGDFLANTTPVTFNPYLNVRKTYIPEWICDALIFLLNYLFAFRTSSVDDFSVRVLTSVTRFRRKGLFWHDLKPWKFDLKTKREMSSSCCRRRTVSTTTTH